MPRFSLGVSFVVVSSLNLSVDIFRVSLIFWTTTQDPVSSQKDFGVEGVVIAMHLLNHAWKSSVKGGNLSPIQY